MTITDVFNATGRGFQWGFQFMKGIGQAPNIFFWIVIISLIFVWLRMQGRFNKEAQEKGTLK